MPVYEVKQWDNLTKTIDWKIFVEYDNGKNVLRILDRWVIMKFLNLSSLCR